MVFPGLRRIAWPSSLLAIALGLMTFRWEIDRHLDVSVGTAAGMMAYLAAAWLCSRLFGLIADRRRQHQRPYPRLFKDLVALLLFFAAVIASTALLMDQGLFGALAGSSLILAVLGFAVRNVVADTLSGVALGVEGPYRIGDWIDIDEVARGRVIEIGWRTTRLLTLDSTYMIVPNSQIARRRITNFSAPRPQYRAQLLVKVNREVPTRAAKRLLLSAIGGAGLIQAEPAPDVKVLDIGGDAITYAVRFWLTRFENDAESRDEVLSLIDAALRDQNVPAPSTRIDFRRDRGVSAESLAHAE